MMVANKSKKMIKPVGQNVLVKPFPVDGVSAGGIYVPDSAKEDSNKVLIVAVGNGTSKNPMRFKEGDIAFRVKDNFLSEIVINGEKHFLMPQSYLLAKLK